MSQPAEAAWPGRFWASRWPEAAWVVFAIGNLLWMVLVPSLSMLPYHFTWMSLLLLYGLGMRSWSRTLTWCLVLPVMTATGLLFVDPAIRGLQPYDEVIELPVMVVMLYVMTRYTARRNAAMGQLDEVSQRNMRLLERQRAFVQNASHELRTPITVALAHAELLPGFASADAASDVAIVVDELGRLQRLVDQLLLLATAEQPGLLHLEPTRLVPFVGGMLRRWEATPRRWLTGCMDEATVLADKDRLAAALDALLDNAVRFTGDGDRIELSVRRHDRKAEISVADSGPGIPADQLDSVFGRFERSDTRGAGASDVHNGHSFGLGLSIVKAVAESHGGRVATVPARLGGTAVTLWFPLYEEADHNGTDALVPEEQDVQVVPSWTCEPA